MLMERKAAAGVGVGGWREEKTMRVQFLKRRECERGYVRVAACANGVRSAVGQRHGVCFVERGKLHPGVWASALSGGIGTEPTTSMTLPPSHFHSVDDVAT